MDQKQQVEIEKEQQVEIENCLKSIRKLKPHSLKELGRRVEEEYDIKAETIVSSATATQVGEQKTTSTVNVSLKILEVSKEAKKALEAYKMVREIINKSVPDKQISSVMQAKAIVDQGKPILESISKPEAEEYKKQLEENQNAKVELTEIK